jgi:hypothetical protein
MISLRRFRSAFNKFASATCWQSSARPTRSVKQVERVRGVIHEVNAITRRNQAKEGSRSRRRSPRVIDEFLCDLFVTERIDFYQVAIISIRGNEAMIPRDRKTERIIEKSPFGNRAPSSR